MAKRRQRRMFTPAESADVWDRWQRGEGLNFIGRVFGKTSSAIFAHLKPHGGIRPPPRTRSPRALSLSDREEISRGMAAGVPLRSVARSLGRAPSTISRELERNGGQGRYRAAAADKRAADLRCIPEFVGDCAISQLRLPMMMYCFHHLLSAEGDHHAEHDDRHFPCELTPAV
jgi:transposase, IS30 family